MPSVALPDVSRPPARPLSARRGRAMGWGDAVLAGGEGATAGGDGALVRNTRGRVACAGTANLFAMLGTTLVTPPLGDGVLAGIVR
ncbi:aminotransferase class IV, partial [Methylobacterium radiotolerans]|uniref:aminotransferase class IV n=1 Tax=Methylobacterium radiotolerans TaxID=31998 RepID=UPI000B91FCF8